MNPFHKLRILKQKQHFNPGFLGIFTNPFYFARKGLYQSIKALAPNISGNILDVGCGQKPYLPLFNYNKYIGLDIENPGHDHANEDIDVYYDGGRFPFPDECFDSILCNQVLEHVFEPEEFLSEIGRSLKPNGHFLLTVPFVWDEHEQPNDYARYSSFGLKYLLNKSGFEIIEYRKSVKDVRVIFQLLICFIFKKTVSKNNIINLFTTLFIISPFNLIGECLNLILPENKDLYLDNVILAKKNSANA
jgi:SAM-dependent methyltransferase